MRREVREQLLALNRSFYGQFAQPFAESRSRPQPGFFRLLDYVSQPGGRWLDVGCGEGRFGRFLRRHATIDAYVGVDFSQELLGRAKSSGPGEYELRDLSRPGCLTGLGSFDYLACLSTMQHLPGRLCRLQLMSEMREALAPGGRIFLANWQFLDSPRQRRKVVDWSVVGLIPDDVDSNDYLLTWQRGGSGLRYVSFIDAVETAGLARDTGLRIVDQYRGDGKEGNLNLYTVLESLD